MKAFKFKLSTLLRKRELEEKELLAQLTALRNKQQEEINKLMDLKNLILKTFEEFKEKKMGVLIIEDMLMYESYLKKIEGDIKEQQKVVVEARIAVQKKRKEFVEASRKKKIIDKYKERCFRNYMAELLQEEYSFQDEFAILGHNIKTHEIFERHKL